MTWISLVALCLSLSFACRAQVGVIPDDKLHNNLDKDLLPPGTITWQVLRQVKLVGDRLKDANPVMRPEFSAQLKKLDKSEVKIYGFMLPLATEPKQKHFLILPQPAHCPFCVSQGPDSMVEVMTREPIELSQFDPIIVSGKLELVNDSSLFYRLTNAEMVKPQ